MPDLYFKFNGLVYSVNNRGDYVEMKLSSTSIRLEYEVFIKLVQHGRIKKLKDNARAGD